MNDTEILDALVLILRQYVITQLPLSPAAIEAALVAVESMRTERRETAVSATIRPA